MNKSILFDTEMVRATLEGRKTVTRRVVKPQPKESVRSGKSACGIGLFDPSGMPVCLSPYQTGDILFVRETWFKHDDWFACKADNNDSDHCAPWHPSIHMPKAAARIFLRVTDVRVERLQEISNKDALHEGVARHGLYNEECYAGGCYNGDFESSCAKCEVPREGFSKLWNSTVKDIDSYGWDANPYVWVISFERCEKPEGFDV